MVGLTVTSSKRTYANKLCLPGLLLPVSLTPEQAGHCRPKPAQETPKHSQEGLAQSPVGARLLYPGCAQVFFIPSKYLCFPQSCGSSVFKS